MQPYYEKALSSAAKPNRMEIVIGQDNLHSLIGYNYYILRIKTSETPESP